MSFALLQDLIVAAVALLAAIVVVRRVIGFAASSDTPKCAGCETGACAPPVAPAPRQRAEDAAAHPLVFVRPSRH